MSQRSGLQFDLEALQPSQAEALVDIEKQIADQDGGAVLAGLEEQYDAFTRGANESLLASDEDLPSGEELGRQFERFLARIDKREQSDLRRRCPHQSKSSSGCWTWRSSRRTSTAGRSPRRRRCPASTAGRLPRRR
ncbi:MAG: hypothetical protein WKF83_04350 [Nocardioidaceae bacterium]